MTRRRAATRTSTTALAAALVAAALTTGTVVPAVTPAPAAYADSDPRTWRVGPDRALTTPSAAAAVAGDGDTVLIDAGTYTGDVAVWTQDDLTLRGVGGRAHLRAGGQSAQGKAIWVIAGDRTRVDRVELSGATVPDGNGAGIRQEGDDLTVTRSWFHDNENGILTGAAPGSDVVVRTSRFFRNGRGDGYTHNLYVGAVRSLTVTGSLLWGADVGHELKSRAVRTTVVGNRISDRGATASYSIDLPNGGRALVAGNVVVQGPRSENPTLVSYGAEGLTHASRQLWVVNNTLVNRRSSGTFVAVADGGRAHLHDNLLVGPGDLVGGDTSSVSANRRVGPGGFRDAAAEDFRLRASSPAIDRGVRVPKRWRARWQYVHPAGVARRPVVGRLDLGAYEHPGRG
ncbi:right-handed parallel beta-helix repeat-containing protein [Nocardioides sp. SOB77]|uniref:Right-handed parallel beta-helix repeat-containing protein n=1 Tax=Nocardioides oceani TaxID=3058369 RepID=A0ABT8FK68_9ACTN|nr:right-handed parallel beta-helix repeat-containing protein [Nocardioides oceani]MDN4175078.1 right-handed parallel beta-helix repeat-containing protein [Nocardioides oceani]